MEVTRSDVKRPLLRYFGGKWQLKNWILEHLPPHRFYAEPFCGAASILLAKSPAPDGEVINDMNEEVVNLFQVMRDSTLAKALIYRLQWTPYASTELIAAREQTDEPIERARRMLVRSFMGITPAGHEDSHQTGLRMGGVTLATFDKVGKRTFRNCAKDWENWKLNVEKIRDRLSNVMIYQKDALEFMAGMDTTECLQYIDPPYCHGSRSESRYSVDFNRHEELVKFSLQSKSMLVISGYDSPHYEELEFYDWKQVAQDYRANMSLNRRTECLWINPAAAKKLWK